MLGIAQRSITAKYGPKEGDVDARKRLITCVKTLGGWIRASRIAKNFTPGHLGAKMGIAHAVIRAWEDGASHPNGQQIRDLTEIFGQVPHDLLPPS